MQSLKEGRTIGDEPQQGNMSGWLPRPTKGLKVALPMTAPSLPAAAEKPFIVVRISRGNVSEGRINVEEFGPGVVVHRRRADVMSCTRCQHGEIIVPTTTST